MIAAVCALLLAPLVPTAVAMFPGERKMVQYDFTVDSIDVKTILVELHWEPTAQTVASGELLTYVSTEWVCDPFCGGTTFVRGGSPSPLILRADVSNATATNTTAAMKRPRGSTISIG